MALRTPVAVLLALLACALPWTGPAQSRVTIRLATQSPLNAKPALGGDEVRLGAQLALDQLGAPLERLGFRLDLAAFDDQGRPDVAVANARIIVASREILAVIGHLDARTAIPASEITKEVSLAMIAPAGTDTLLTDRGLPAVNRIVGRDDVQGTVAAIFAAATLAVKSA
jgi:branched-chain amino acid transport system substrate-binding protein